MRENVCRATKRKDLNVKNCEQNKLQFNGESECLNFASLKTAMTSYQKSIPITKRLLVPTKASKNSRPLCGTNSYSLSWSFV